MRTFILALFVILFAASGANAQSPCAAGIAFPGFPLSQTLNGVPVSLPATATVTGVSNGTATICVVVDLSDLQQKIGSVVDTFHFPTDNCASYSPRNPVVSLPTKQLTYATDSAVLNLVGSVTDWECLQNPIPNSKIVWEMRKIGSFKTLVPVVVTWPAPPIKTVLLVQPFNASLPFHLTTVNPQTIELQPGVPSISLQGQYAFITNGVLSIAGVNINVVAYNALKSALNSPQLIAKLPPTITVHVSAHVCAVLSNPQFTGPQHFANPGALAAVLNVNGAIAYPVSC
jgi:hypothetical protein